jgi:hypothetical protein
MKFKTGRSLLKLRKNIEGKASGQGFGQRGRESGSGADEMIKRIHESAGTPKLEENESSDDRSVDTPAVKTIESTDEPTPVKTDLPRATLTTEQMDAIISVKVDQELAVAAKEREALERKLAEKETEIAAVQKQREADCQNFESQSAFFAKYGFAKDSGGTGQKERSSDRDPGNVAIALRHQQGIIAPCDSWKEYCKIHDQSPSESIDSRRGGRVTQRDTRHSDGWFKEHFRGMLPAIDQFARDNGLLKGGKEAVTSRADVIPMLLEVLSAYTRVSHHPAHIWGMFANITVELGKRNGEIVDVPRFAYAASRRNRSDWDLTNVGTLSTSAQAVQAGMSQVVIKEWGMGKPGLPGETNAPIGMSTFLNSISVLDLMSVVDNNLGYNYREFETAQILDGLYATTPVRYYNKKGSIVTQASSVVANDGGTCTAAFLRAVSAQMATDSATPYSNGKYIAALGPNELKQLEDSLDPIKQVMVKADMAEMTRIFSQSTGVGDLNYDGYKGDLGDFMIYSTNTLYQGPVAAPGGVTLQETIAGGLKDIHIGYAFGANAVARGIAQPFNVRRSSNTDFDRSEILVWNSYEGFGALDINSNLDPVGTAVPQQNRVFELRFTTVPV